MGRKVSKAGCTTCKLRKVKCDQGFPACCRCVSSGRTCDGYGIWGGGGNLFRFRRHPALAPSRWKAPFRPDTDVTRAEATYFDWFRDYSSTKLPGSFFSEFWTTFVMQASASEPAVWHAVVALSSAHHARGGDSFTLRHYTQAIRHLQPYFSNKNEKSSIRVALIACLVFVAIDILRGHIVTAKMHYESGLRLLQGTSKTVGDADSESKYLPLIPTRESVDKSIVEVFSRFSMQVSISKHMFNKPGIILETVYPERETPHFTGIKQAWVEIQGLMSRTFLLGRQVRDYHREMGVAASHQASSSSSSSFSFSLSDTEKEEEEEELPASYLELQRHIVVGLESWKTAYETCRSSLLGTESLEDKKMYLVLYTYHTMAQIMAGTCLHPGNEDVFDAYTRDFELLISQLESMKGINNSDLKEHVHHRRATPSPSDGGTHDQIPPRSSPLFPGTPAGDRSIVDVGWIPPLYYTAVKCRHHGIRWRALRLLESSGHKEGFWDSGLMGPVARKVVETEEAGFFSFFYPSEEDDWRASREKGETTHHHHHQLDDDDGYNAAATQDQQQQQQQKQRLSSPPLLLPSDYRLRDVEISLSGESAEKVSLHYNAFRQQSEGEGPGRIHLSDYYRELGVWIDV